MRQIIIPLCVALLLAGHAHAEIGRISSVAGTATYSRGNVVSPATRGLILEVSDVLATGPDGQIGVTFNDYSRLRLSPRSRVALSQFEFDDTTRKGEALITVDRGNIAVDSGLIAKENPDGMKVRTPTSLIAARGPRFVVNVK
jgi:hypothetical protein